MDDGFARNGRLDIRIWGALDVPLLYKTERGFLKLSDYHPSALRPVHRREKLVLPAAHRRGLGTALGYAHIKHHPRHSVKHRHEEVRRISTRAAVYDTILSDIEGGYPALVSGNGNGNRRETEWKRDHLPLCLECTVYDLVPELGCSGGAHIELLSFCHDSPPNPSI